MEGDKVKISIPLANVLDVEMNTMAFAEAIQVKVMESDESFAVDEVCKLCSWTRDWSYSYFILDVINHETYFVVVLLRLFRQDSSDVGHIEGAGEKLPSKAQPGFTP